MKYYYLDGIEKKGPYEKEELKNYNINAETLVFFEGLSNWKPIKDIPELNSYLFEIVLANDTNDFKNNLEDAKSDNINNIEVTEPPKIKIPSIALLFLSFLKSFKDFSFLHLLHIFISIPLIFMYNKYIKMNSQLFFLVYS